ncbi:MAG: hypothetical protein LLG14_08430 [Nocardiaceae bacterium]|nr:hypothetical protein [Nocardiaceae bacterium]
MKRGSIRPEARLFFEFVEGQVWFGETTPYPVSGMAAYSPDDFDYQMGRFWTLPTL